MFSVMRSISLILLLGCVGYMSGCSKGAPESESAAPSESQEKIWRIGMSQSNLGEPWRVQMNADISRAADAYPDIQLILRDAQNDTLRQRAHIEEFLNQGVDLLLVSPKEPALQETIAKVYRAGIPVIVLDRDVGGEDFTQFIGADNYLIGKAAGTYIRESLGGAGRVVELKGLMTTVPGQDRHRGFRDAIAGSDVAVIFEADMQWLEPNARKEMESALARFTDIDLVYAHNDPGAHGAWLAARAAGRENDMAFVGIDALPQEGQVYVREGILDATFLYPTGGGEAIESARKILQGETVAKRHILDSRVFTADNVAEGGLHLDLSENDSTGAGGVISVQQGNLQSNIDAAIGGQQPEADTETNEAPSGADDAITIDRSMLESDTEAAREAGILRSQGATATAHTPEGLPVAVEDLSEAMEASPDVVPGESPAQSTEAVEAPAPGHDRADKAMDDLHLQHDPADKATDDLHLQHDPADKATDDLHLQHDPADKATDDLHLQHDPADKATDDLHLKHDPVDSAPNERY